MDLAIGVIKVIGVVDKSSLDGAVEGKPQSENVKGKWEERNWDVGNSQEVYCKGWFREMRLVLGEGTWD